MQSKADIKKFLATAIITTGLDQIQAEVKARRLQNAKDDVATANFTFQIKIDDKIVDLVMNGLTLQDLNKICDVHFKAPEAEKPRNQRGIFDRWIDPKFPRAIPGSIRHENGWVQVSFPIPSALHDELMAAGLTYKTALLKGLASTKLFDALAKEQAAKDKAEE